MYNTLIRPVSLEYGNIGRCNWTDEDNEILQSIQIRAERIITRAIVRTNTKCLDQEIGFTTLSARQANIIMFFTKYLTEMLHCI